MIDGPLFRQKAQDALAAAARSKDPTVQRGWAFVAGQWTNEADWWEKRESAASEGDIVDWVAHLGISRDSQNGHQTL